MPFKLLWLTVFIMFFQPTIVFPFLSNYSPLKYSAICALLAYIFSAKEKGASFFSSNINIYFCLFIVLQIISGTKLWVYHGIEIFNLWLRYGIVYFLIFKTGQSLTKIKWLTSAIVLAIAYLCYFSISNFVLNHTSGMRAGGFGWYDNSNDLSVILVSVIPLGYLLFETANGMTKKIFFGTVTGMFAFNLLFTGSRNGLLGLFTVGMLSIILSKIPKTLRLGLVILLCSSILGIGLATVLDRVDLMGLSGDESSEHRLEQWRACRNMLKENPFLGVGPGEVPGEIANYGGIRGLAPHNTVLLAFAETGIPGGIFYVLFGFTPLWVFLKKIKIFIQNKSTEWVFYKYLCVSLAGFWVCAIFSNRVRGYLLYILVALIVATKNYIYNNSKVENNL